MGEAPRRDIIESVYNFLTKQMIQFLIKFLMRPALVSLLAINTAGFAAERDYDPEVLKTGKTLFRVNCATCHGTDAEGAPNWQKRTADGKYPPPPLNGSAHTWHHPRSALVQTIQQGTIKLGGSMPPWQNKLDDQQIEAIITWLTSLWPDEPYEIWMTQVNQ